MYDFNKQTDPVRNPQFRRRWLSVVPPSPDQIKLAKFRAVHGNIAGTNAYLAERRGERVRT